MHVEMQRAETGTESKEVQVHGTTRKAIRTYRLQKRAEDES